MLKQYQTKHPEQIRVQPPLGGCVLKLNRAGSLKPNGTAAFRRLCVETQIRRRTSNKRHQPPSGGCVLKQIVKGNGNVQAGQPPSGGCVLKPYVNNNVIALGSQPPSGGCVLKLSSA